MFRILYRFLTSMARLAVRSGRTKESEIIVLRHELTVLQRQSNRPTLIDHDRTLLGGIAAALPCQPRASATPDTLLKWHRRRTARHWTQPARPSTTPELRWLIIEMATDNPAWGYRRISGEVTGLGHDVGASTVWRILKRHDIEPAPHRSSVTWTQSLRSQSAVACDFATIDTALLRRYYLLFFIEHQGYTFQVPLITVSQAVTARTVGAPQCRRLEFSDLARQLRSAEPGANNVQPRASAPRRPVHSSR